MAALYRLLAIDTCPLCGDVMSVDMSQHLGKEAEDIPRDAVFCIGVAPHSRTRSSCGFFRITKRDKYSREDNWVAEYIPKPTKIF